MGAAKLKEGKQQKTTTDQPGQFLRVIASGRIGQIVCHDPDDTLLTYKLKFSDGTVPEVDWFEQSSVEEATTENESSADFGCLKCPNGHLITYDDNQDREDDYGIICEGCDMYLGKAVRAHYTCRPCRWDLCPDCHANPSRADRARHASMPT